MKRIQIGCIGVAAAATAVVFLFLADVAVAQKGQWQEYSLPAASQRGHKWDTSSSDRDGHWIVVTSPGGHDLLRVHSKSRIDRDWKPLSPGDRDGRQWNIVAPDVPLMMKVQNVSGGEVQYKVSPPSTVIPVN